MLFCLCFSHKQIYKINECTDDQVRREFVEYKKQVEKAEDAYNNLSEDEKKCITYFDLAILNTGKTMVSQLEEVNSDISKAENFVNRVNALSTYSSYQSQDQINAIAKEINDLRGICENLPYNMQLVIPQDTYQKLFEAENALLLYNADQEGKQLNQEQANEVISKINDINFNQILNSKEQITRARSAYNDLNEGAKLLVTNLNKLESSERVLEVVKAIYDLPKNITFRNSIIGPDINPKGIGLFQWFMKQENEVGGYSKVIWTGVTTIELAKQIEGAIKNNLTGLNHVVNNDFISKKDLLALFKESFNKDIVINDNDTVVSEKTLVIMVSHERKIAYSYSDYIIEVCDGKVVYKA